MVAPAIASACILILEILVIFKVSQTLSLSALYNLHELISKQNKNYASIVGFDAHQLVSESRHVNPSTLIIKNIFILMLFMDYQLKRIIVCIYSDYIKLY